MWNICLVRTSVRALPRLQRTPPNMNGSSTLLIFLISLPQKRLVTRVAQLVKRLSYGINRLKIGMRLPAGENLITYATAAC
jgi:hypothetical protein